MKKIIKKINNPRFKHGTASIVITFSVITMIILLYSISILLHNKFHLAIDMTANKKFEISEQSKDYITNLKNKITIRVMSPEKDFSEHPYYPEQYNQLNHILKLYKKNSDNISLVYDDVIKNPRLAEKYDNQVNQYSVVVEAENNRYKVLNIDNLFDIEQNYMSQNLKASKAEQAIISSIVAITSNDQLRVGVLSGHQEVDVSGLEKLLLDNLYDVSKINLLTSEIPQELTMLVIAAPQKDFTTQEIEKLNKYLDNNGNYGRNILYFANISGEVLPNLNSFLRSWDFNVEKAIVFDQSNMTQLGQYSSIVEYSDQDLFESLINKNAFTVFLNSSPITFINQETENKTHSELLRFSDNALGLRYSEDSIESPEEASLEGPFLALAKTTKTKEINNKNVSSSVVISSSVVSVDGALLYQIPVSNADTYLNVINNITDKKDFGINIVSKDLQGEMINFKQSTVNILRLIFVVFVPAIVIGVGLSVWISRRHK